MGTSDHWRGRLPGRADGYPSGPPTDPYVRNSRIRFLKQSCCCPRKLPACSTVHWLSVLRVRELDVSPLSPTSGGSARRRLPSRGSLGPHFPTFLGTMRRDDCRPAPLGVLRLSLASPIPCLLPWVRGVPEGLGARAEAPGHARACGHPVPHSGYATRRQVALPSSRVPPLKTCPALRPRWCPAHAPKRTQDCCLPVTGNRRLSSFSTTLHISGLHHAACLLATPGSVRPLAGRHAGSLLTCC